MSNPMSPSGPQPLAPPNIWPIVIAWGKGDCPSARQRRQLVAWELSDLPRAMAWQLPTDNVEAVADALTDRAALLQQVAGELDQGTCEMPLLGHWSDWIALLWTFWLPLAQQIDRAQRRLNTTFVQGILGGQGTGKTTLTQILRLILRHLGQSAVSLSIDDLYLTYAQRLSLRQQDPRFMWRGPPGTHDVALGLQTLQRVKTAAVNSQVSLPQFDKSLYAGQGDRIEPLMIDAPTILLFEGWFVGARPLAAHIFQAPASLLPAPIVTAADREFAADSNRRLYDYLPLWDSLDSLIVLHPKDYRQSQRWRQQAEQKMKAQGKTGLSDAEITNFVTYFWKALHPELFITPLTQTPETSLVVSIQSDHSLCELYAPKNGNPGSMS